MLLELPLALAGCALSLTLVGPDAVAAFSGATVEPTFGTVAGGLIGAGSVYLAAVGAQAFEAKAMRALWLLVAMLVAAALAAAFGLFAVRERGLGAGAAAAVAVAIVCALGAALWRSQSRR